MHQENREDGKRRERRTEPKVLVSVRNGQNTYIFFRLLRSLIRNMVMCGASSCPHLFPVCSHQSPIHLFHACSFISPVKCNPETTSSNIYFFASFIFQHLRKRRERTVEQLVADCTDSQTFQEGKISQERKKKRSIWIYFLLFFFSSVLRSSQEGKEQSQK